MISLPAYSIANVVKGQLVSGPGDRVCSGGVSTDTRTIQPHAVFFALSGENFDGNEFAPLASKNAACVVVSRVAEGIDSSTAVVQVDDVLLALQKLASWWRDQLGGLKVIGLTGSNGKTSTKDFLASILKRAGKTIATKGNLNNHIGVPLSVLDASPDDEYAVWEMGMNHAGELRPLCDIIRPHMGIITSIGSSHIEFLGTKENIAKEKATLAECLPADGVLLFPVDCEFAPLLTSSHKGKSVSVGIHEGDVEARNVESNGQGTIFHLRLP